MLSRQLAQAPRETRGVGTTTPMLPTTGSKITPAIRAPCSANASFKSGDVVVLQHERVLRRAGRDARRIGHAERRRRAAGRHQQAIDVPVVVAGELDDHVAAGEAAGQADRAHRGFGAGVDQPHLLDARHGLDDQLGQLALGLGRRAEARAAASGRFDRGDDGRMRVAEDQRPPGADVVDVAVAVDVPQIRALAALDDDRLAADAAERPRRAVHAARHELLALARTMRGCVRGRFDCVMSLISSSSSLEPVCERCDNASCRPRVVARCKSMIARYIAAACCGFGRRQLLGGVEPFVEARPVARSCLSSRIGCSVRQAAARPVATTSRRRRRFVGVRFGIVGPYRSIKRLRASRPLRRAIGRRMLIACRYSCSAGSSDGSALPPRAWRCSLRSSLSSSIRSLIASQLVGSRIVGKALEKLVDLRSRRCRAIASSSPSPRSAIVA